MAAIPAFRPSPAWRKCFAESFARLAAVVPAKVELGFHLCYGDLDGAHFVQPRDALKMAELANLIAGSVQRSLQWIHMPVPIDRNDDAYFAPLRDLALPATCELFLGLVHAGDGIEGARRRIERARRYAPAFGIATECGIARARRPELVRRILELHAGIAAADG
jgi:hypothetical protein